MGAVARAGMLIYASRECRYRGRLEHQSHGNLGIQRGPDSRGNPRRYQAVSAEGEERIVHTDGIETQNIRETPGNNLLGRRAGAPGKACHQRTPASGSA